MKKIFALLAVVLLTVAILSLAATARAEPLPVDRGRIYRDIVREKTTSEMNPQAEVSASSWRPRTTEYSTYQKQNIPQVSLRFVVPAFRLGSVAFRGVGGLSYLSLTHDEAITLPDGVRTTNEHQISTLEMPLGFEIAPRGLAWGRLSGFAEIGALPALFVFGHSLDGDGSSNGGLGAYGDLGALFNFGGPRFDSFSLVATAGYRSRISGDIDTEGFAARFGVRVGL
jgi:hypothetical protein